MHVERLTPYISSLGSRIQPFYDDSVTHVVSENPRSNVAQTARAKGRKVYNIDKLTRFLNSILGPNCDVARPAANARLAQMLAADERVLTRQTGTDGTGWTTIQAFYILVWDHTLVNRTLCVKEWPMCKSVEEGLWPQLRSVPLGYCPFVPRPVMKSEKRKAEISPVKLERDKENAVPEGTLDERKKRKVKEESERALVQDAIAEDTRPPLYTVSAKSVSARSSGDDDDDEQHDPYIRAQTTSQATRPESPAPLAHTSKSTRLREFGEIVASGMQRYSQTSAKSGMAPSAPSREMVNLRRKVLPKAHSRHIKPEARIAARKPGFCENCLQKYGDLAEHLQGASHVQFSKNEKKFASVDAIIALLRRPAPPWASY